MTVTQAFGQSSPESWELWFRGRGVEAQEGWGLGVDGGNSKQQGGGDQLETPGL